jgi:hypothetical protein
MFLVPLVNILLNTNACEMIRGHVVTALIDLTNPEYCTSTILLPYLDSLLHALLIYTQGASLNVQPSCLTLIGYIFVLTSVVFINLHFMSNF